MRRYSARGLQAIQMGRLPLDRLSAEMGIPLASLVNAPKAEWHHDYITGERVWFYDRGAVWSYVQGAGFKAAEKRARSLRNNCNKQVSLSAPVG